MDETWLDESTASFKRSEKSGNNSVKEALGQLDELLVGALYLLLHV